MKAKLKEKLHNKELSKVHFTLVFWISKRERERAEQIRQTKTANNTFIRHLVEGEISQSLDRNG